MAALEFVLGAPLFIVVLGGAWDLGFAQSCRTSLANAVAAGAWYALFQGTSVTAANISLVVKNSSYLNIAFMSVTVNGPGTYCFNSSTPPALVSQSTTCADGSSPGAYVIITANYTNNGLMNAFMSAATLTMTEKATVRVQ